MKDTITGSIPEDDNRLMKFHGSYMQDDRDLRNERAKAEARASLSVHASCACCWRNRYVRTMVDDGSGRTEICERYDPSDDSSIFPTARCP